MNLPLAQKLEKKKNNFELENYPVGLNLNFFPSLKQTPYFKLENGKNQWGLQRFDIIFKNKVPKKFRFSKTSLPKKNE